MTPEILEALVQSFLLVSSFGAFTCGVLIVSTV